MADADDPFEPDLPDDAPERDENTSDMFGAPAPALAPEPAAAAPAYTVIARKYRPRAFEDLIGQEAMVRTLKNAFASGRIAHAFMLTGVRGVGKTTTARLLARALNYDSATIHQPDIEHLATEGRHCRAIMEGRHIDVLELDAASHNGVAEMRELLDGVRYAPIEARYRVFILDEVHMLSTAAFNALLKTLEEPPPHAKFIFATTEIRKVPVTILSRCQRFDLRRVEPAVIAANLKEIAAREGAQVEDEALTLIGRAAEGSVRDAQSLLDQAIVQAEEGAPVTAILVRDMLGLADRGETIALFEHVMRGEAAAALERFRVLFGYGADPGQVMMDLLEHAHAAAVSKTIGVDALALPKEQAGRLAAVGASASAGTLSRLWQMLLKAQAEVKSAPDPMAAGEMALIRLAYAADLPGPEEALKALREGTLAPPTGGGGGGGVSAGLGGGGGAVARAAAPSRMVAPQPAPEGPPVLASFDDVLKLIDARRDVGLKLDVERFVRPIAFRMGAITYEAAPGAPANLAGRLVSRLKEWTGQTWIMAAEGGGGAESAWEREKRLERETRAEVEADPFVQSLLGAFPGAQIVGIRQLVAPEPAGPEVVEGGDEED